MSIFIVTKEKILNDQEVNWAQYTQLAHISLRH